MRVLLVGTGRRPIPPPAYGSIELLIAEYANALTSAGEQVDIVNQFRPDRYTSGWAFERRLPMLLRHRPRDIVHVHTSRAALMLGMAGVPYVFTTHTARWLDPKGSNFLQNALFERERFAVRFALATVVETEALRQVVSRVRGRRGPVVMIPCGTDVHKFKARTEGIPHRVLGVGVIERRKRWHLAAEAFEGTGIHFTVAGPLREMDYVAELRAAHVDLQGEISDAALLEEFEKASFFVHPSRSEVGMARAPLQAMSFSRPVIGGPAIGGMPGVIVCPSDRDEEMRAFIRKWGVALDTDPAFRREQAAKARAIAEKENSWEAVAQAHLTLYRELLAG